LHSCYSESPADSECVVYVIAYTAFHKTATSFQRIIHNVLFTVNGVLFALTFARTDSVQHVACGTACWVTVTFTIPYINKDKWRKRCNNGTVILWRPCNTTNPIRRLNYIVKLIFGCVFSYNNFRNGSWNMKSTFEVVGQQKFGIYVR